MGDQSSLVVARNQGQNWSSKCVQLFEVPVSARGNVSTAKLTWPCAVCPPKTSWCAHGGGMGSGVTRMAKPSATSPKRKKGMLQPRYVDVHFGQC